MMLMINKAAIRKVAKMSICEIPVLKVSTLYSKEAVIKSCILRPPGHVFPAVV